MEVIVNLYWRNIEKIKKFNIDYRDYKKNLRNEFIIINLNKKIQKNEKFIYSNKLV